MLRYMKRQASLLLDICPDRNAGNVCPACPKVCCSNSLTVVLYHLITGKLFVQIIDYAIAALSFISLFRLVEL